MKILIVGVISVFIFLLHTNSVSASSEKVYKDYLYQYDVYRQKYSEFKIAKNEYDKFKSLTSETVLLDKTKLLLTSRNFLLKTYLLVLKNKLIENRGMIESEKGLYQTLIDNEVKFLDENSLLIPSIVTLQDASRVADLLTSHYQVLNSSMYQTVIVLSLGNLEILSRAYDDIYDKFNIFIDANRQYYPASKKSISGTWMNSIKSKRTLNKEKVNLIKDMNDKLRNIGLTEMQRSANNIIKNLNEAKLYLQEGASYMEELKSALKNNDD